MFSIVIPLYNKYEYISRALDSVINQSFKDYEIIIVNDGSTDGSDKIVEDKYGPQVRIIHQKNKGVSTARNTGIKYAKNDYIAFLDADDIWHPEYLFYANQAVNSTHLPGIIGADFFRFKSLNDLEQHRKEEKMSLGKTDFRVYSIADFFNQAINHTLIFTSAVIVKKEFFKNNKGFDPQLKFGEDLDVWYRAILYYKKLVFIQEELVYYSREDLLAATKKNYLLEQTLIPKIIEDEFFPLNTIEDQIDLHAFKAFRIKWIYLRLFPNYKLKENDKAIATLLPKLEKRYMVFGWIYILPFGLLHQAFIRKYPYKLWGRYLKFCFKHFKIKEKGSKK